jgi:hypothetical protein
VIFVCRYARHLPERAGLTCSAWCDSKICTTTISRRIQYPNKHCSSISLFARKGTHLNPEIQSNSTRGLDGSRCVPILHVSGNKRAGGYQVVMEQTKSAGFLAARLNLTRYICLVTGSRVSCRFGSAAARWLFVSRWARFCLFNT